MKGKSKKTKHQKRFEKDRMLVRKVAKNMTDKEWEAIDLTVGNAFEGLFREYAEKYGVELPSFFEPPKSFQETTRPLAIRAVRAGLHAEMQKFGHKPDPKQPSLFDSLSDEDAIKKAKDCGVEVIGMDLTYAQNRAYFAIQRLMSETGYKGNIPGESVRSKGFKYNGHLPLLEFTPAEYLEAYGVKKHEATRGKREFSGEARRDALRALIDLAKKQFLFVYKRTYWLKSTKGKREKQVDRIETMDTILQIIRGWKALTKYEDRLLDEGKSNEATDEKLKAIAIKPAPILVQDIDSYYLLKPANYLQEIKMLDPFRLKYSKYFPRFIDWLVTQAELKRRRGQPLVIEIGFKELGYKLRMDTYIKNRMWLRMRQSFNKCYRQAKELGYLLEYETIQGQTKELERLVLNPDKYEEIRRLEKEREKLAGKKPISQDFSKAST